MRRVAIGATAVVLALAGVYWLLPGLVLRVAMVAEHAAAGLHEHRLSVDGHEIVYLDGGSGPTLLAFHGFAADKDNWTRLASHLTARYRVIAPDLPGFGESTRRDDAHYDIASQVERMHAFATALGLGRVHVMGNSMGGQIAAVYAARHPESVDKLVLFAPAGLPEGHPRAMREALAAGRNLLLVTDVADYDRLLSLVFVQVPWIPGPVRRHFAEVAVRNREVNERIWRDAFARPLPLASMLASIATPTLLVWGDADQVLDPAAALPMQAAMPAARLVMMEHCGHAPMIERPDEAAHHVLEFLSR